MAENRRVLLLKPPDPFLENEFVYPQLGPHYLQSFLAQHKIESDILVLFQKHPSETGQIPALSLEECDTSTLRMLLIKHDGTSVEDDFDHTIFAEYGIVGFSVMTPQAPYAYQLNEVLKTEYPQITSIIGGSHPRYYQEQVISLPESIAFDFVVPQDGWIPLLQIVTGEVLRLSKPTLLSHSLPKLTDLPPPSRPLSLLRKYNFEVAGVAAYHTITALGCPFTCNFCESGIERVRTFSPEMIREDLTTIAQAHDSLGHRKKAVMFFDDVGLMSPKQVARLSSIVNICGFDTWRAFTHAYLVVKHQRSLLGPFLDTGGRRIGMGLETGSQRSLDLINKRNGKKQSIEEHYHAVEIANSLGIAVDAFTMIYPWEDENDLFQTNQLIEFIASNTVNGLDEKGRPMYNHIDSTIMSPYQGTIFYDMIKLGSIPNVLLDPSENPGSMYYKGIGGNSGWPYKKTRLPRSTYEAAQIYRNSLRPSYR